MAKNVLIVDDNEHLRQILAAILRFSGYEIVEAASGAQAIQKAASTQPSLILMDFELPDMNGADATRLIRQNPATAHIPIVGCSAFIGSEWPGGGALGRRNARLRCKTNFRRSDQSKNRKIYPV